jgi:hypothetical protein
MASTIDIRTDGEIKRRARQLSESPGPDMPFVPMTPPPARPASGPRPVYRFIDMA